MSEERVEATENQEQQMEELMGSIPEVGQVVKGIVAQINPDEVLVSFNYKSDGIIPARELSFRDNVRPEEIVTKGEEIYAEVIKIDDGEGNVILSKRKAEAKRAWDALEKVHADGEIVTATVVQVVKGGLLVDVGVRGFIPASHISRNFEEDLEKYVGKELKLKIIELDHEKNNVVFSHREVLNEEYQKAKEQAFESLTVNSKVPGVVRRITNFGAFVDIGSGVEGLLHVSEMAYSRVSHPSDVVSEGDEVSVMILGIDKDKERISLGLKQTLADPWDTITDRYKEGDVVEGEVTRVVDFGAFIKLEDGVEGLAHISQLSQRHVTKADEVVRPKDVVKAKIISLDSKEHRIGLSIKELEPKVEAPPNPRSHGQSQKSAPRTEQLTDTEEFTHSMGDQLRGLFEKK